LAVAEPPTKHVFSLCGATMVPSWLRFAETMPLREGDALSGTPRPLAPIEPVCVAGVPPEVCSRFA